MAYETIKENIMTPLHIASINGQLEVMKEIVEQCPDSLDAVTSQGQNVLHLTYSTNQNTEMIDFLKEQRWLYDLSIQREADGNKPDYSTGKTVLSHPLLEFNSVYDAVSAEKEKKDKEEKEKKDRAKGKGRLIERSSKYPFDSGYAYTNSFFREFTIPGGFHSYGPNEGMAILGKKAAVKAFAITDTIAMITSSSAVFLHFLASIMEEREKKSGLYTVAFYLVMVAMIAMMIVFMTDLYAMQSSTSLAVFICVSCSLSLIFFIFIFILSFI